MSDEDDGGAVGKIQVLTPEQLSALNQAKVNARPSSPSVYWYVPE